MSNIEHNIEAARRAVAAGGPSGGAVSSGSPVPPTPPGPPSSGRRRTALIAAAALATVIVVALGAAVAWQQLHGDGEQTAEEAGETATSGTSERGGKGAATMPDLVGMTHLAATRAMADHGVDVEAWYFDGESRCAEDDGAVVMTQEPAAGARVDDVELTLDRIHGDGTVVLPDLTGWEWEVAVEALREIEVAAEVTGSEVPAANVVDQSVPSCGFVFVGDTVQLTAEVGS